MTNFISLNNLSLNYIFQKAPSYSTFFSEIYTDFLTAYNDIFNAIYFSSLESNKITYMCR